VNGDVERFALLFINDFFCHYYVSKATDIIICDKCIAQEGEGECNAEVDKEFANMLRGLKDMDLEKKRLFLAFKGIDSMMKQEIFKRMHDLSRPKGKMDVKMTDKRDPNLVYSFFLLLLSKARKQNLFGKDDDNLIAPKTITEKEARMWLAEENRRHIPDKAATMAVDKYNNLDEHNCSQYFNTDAKVNGCPIGDHINKRVKEFCRLAPDICHTDVDDGQTSMGMLGIPPHTYFVSTPIDEDCNFCGYDLERPGCFEGKAMAYDQRMHFGSLQLTIDILNDVNINYSNDYKAYGQLLKYCFNQ
jgi:hypothetical protein